MMPVKGLVWLAEIVRDQVDQEHENQSHSARRLLDEIEAARAAGEISDEEARRREPEILAQITGLPTAGEAARHTSNADSG
ncbi:gas vesicle protein GvpG [Stackebrandtia soli]|uniref:gas vesicle protein GvpG n=1 Tax=Stackebrandtia soli TaxID=1892856 RepID=UPI0039E78313